MDTKPISVGIAGLGRSGWCIHAESLSEFPDKYRVTAVFDQDPARLKEAAERFSCNTYSEYEGFLADESVELVIVATPSHLHAPHTIAALKAGHHVLCEKPMAVSLEEADQMIKTARSCGRILTIFQNRRYDPDFLKVKEVIESGKIGRVLLIRMVQHFFQRRNDWQTLKQYGGGIVNNWGAHSLDQAMLLIGEEEPEVLCQLAHTVSAGDAEDHAKITLKTPSGLIVDVEMSSCAAFSQENWFVIGTCGGIRGTSKELTIKWFDPATLPALEVDPRPPEDRSYGKPEDIPWQREVWRAEESRSLGWKKIYLDLYRTIREGAPLVITPESVRRHIALIARCKQLCPV